MHTSRARACLLACLLLACHTKEAPRPPDLARRPPQPVVLSKVERISAPDPAFGAAVAASGDLLAVGAPGPLTSRGPGAVLVYQREPTGWQQAAKLVARGCSRLGQSVALDGDTLVAGGRGCIGLFTRTGAGWKQVAPLTASGTEFLGERVAISGDTILVSDDWKDVGEKRTAGAVQIYRRTGDSWIQEAPLTASPPEWGATFGSDAAMAGRTIIVGARQAKLGNADAVGAVHLFERGADGWREVFGFQPPEAREFSTLGHSVSIDGDGDGELALAGSQGQRRAFAFERRAGGWQAIGTLDAPEPAQGRENFGAACAVRGDLGAVSIIPHSENLSPRGKVLVYQRDGDGWRHVRTLVHPALRSDDEFGRALAFTSSSLFVGAPGLDEVVVYSSLH
jgi:FG-GAP repeat